MSESSSLEQILSQAEELEKEYDWLEAVEFYKKALGLASDSDFSRRGRIYEQIGYDFYRAAMQAENVDQFRDRMCQAAVNYEKAGELYEKQAELRKVACRHRCDAMIAYIKHWLASEVPEKRRLLDECWGLAKTTLKAFEEAGDALEYGKTFNELSSSVAYANEFNEDIQTRKTMMSEAVEFGERAITLVSATGDSCELAKASVKTGIWLSTYGNLIPNLEEIERLRSKSLDYWEKAKELSEETAWLELLSISASFEWNIEEMQQLFEKGLDYAKKTKDKSRIGNALDWLAYVSFWQAVGEDDPDKRTNAYQRALQYAEDARYQFSAISLASSRGGVLWSGAPHAEYYWELSLWETDANRRRDLLEKAALESAGAVELAERVGYLEIIMQTHHVLSKVLGSLAQTKTNAEEKRRLLERALKHRKKTLIITEQRTPFNYWNHGANWNYLADLKAELSNIEENPERKRSLLEEATSNKERCLQLCIMQNLIWEKRGNLSYYSSLGLYQYSYGQLLSLLYGLTNNSESQRMAINAFKESASSFQKLDMVSRVAECCWKVARGYDALGEHLKAAETFNLASNMYKNSAEKIPQLSGFYQDYMLYMQAWEEIEKARNHHRRQEYGSAKEHFGSAARLHTLIKQWSYLAPNYLAWVQLEDAEDLSRNDKSEEAIKGFEQATNLFVETTNSIQTQLINIADADERQMAIDLAKAIETRREYCVGRIALEEARILDKNGDHSSSAEKYASAAETFERIAKTLASEQDRKEFELIKVLSRAWQKMVLAEAEESPNLYVEAFKLFEDVKELNPSEKGRMLALGHSRFCKALEAGARFTDAREEKLYIDATQHLESAASYYVKAGFQNASEYAKATGMLFDAYVYVDRAKRQVDPERKTKFYTMAEKVLQTSASSYMKAEHPEKREQVLRLLQKVIEERDLAVSLTEVLHAPSIVSATIAFPTPTSTYERAVGFEKLEHANIQASAMVHPQSLNVDEEMNIELELVNAGKGHALLTKIEEVFPEGFEVIEKPEMYRVEDGCLNLRGKRLDPLKIEKIRLVLTPNAKGVFPFKPRVSYIDESGKPEVRELEPITITVKELGILGWLKGPEKRKRR